MSATSADTLRDFLIELGSAMNAAGDSVGDVHERLAAIATAYDAPQTRLAVTPTSLLVSIPGVSGADLAMSSEVNLTLRLDQTAAVFALANAAERGELDLRYGCDELVRIATRPSRFPAWVVIVGHAVLTVGLVLLLRPAWLDLLGGLILGGAVGALKHWAPRAPALVPILPVFAAFGVSVIAFSATSTGLVESPLRLVIAPLITFLPGAALTTGTMDISAGQMISGTGRLVQGTIQLLLLGFGIVAASELVGLTADQAFDDSAPPSILGPAAPWVGVLLFAIGMFLHLSGGRGTLPWMLLVLFVAYAAQVIGTGVFGGTVSGFVGAVVMVPVALFVSEQPHGPPLMATFMPAFWLLVPGAVGLLGVTQLLGSDASGVGADVLLNTAATIVAIALGVLVGMSTRKPVIRVARMALPRSTSRPDRVR